MTEMAHMQTYNEGGQQSFDQMQKNLMLEVSPPQKEQEREPSPMAGDLKFANTESLNQSPSAGTAYDEGTTSKR